MTKNSRDLLIGRKTHFLSASMPSCLLMMKGVNPLSSYYFIIPLSFFVTPLSTYHHSRDRRCFHQRNIWEGHHETQFLGKMTPCRFPSLQEIEIWIEDLCWQTPIQGGWRGGGGYVRPRSFLIKTSDGDNDQHKHIQTGKQTHIQIHERPHSLLMIININT